MSRPSSPEKSEKKRSSGSPQVRKRSSTEKNNKGSANVGIEQIAPTPVWTSPPKRDPFAFIPPSLRPLLYWEDVRISGPIFIAGVMSLSVLFFGDFTIVSLLSYILLVSVGLAGLYIKAAQYFDRWTGRPVTIPFEQYYDLRITIPREKILSYIDDILKEVENFANVIKDLIIVKDTHLSARFFVGMFFMALFGDLFSIGFLISITFIGAFVGPILYRNFHVQIDEKLDRTVDHIEYIWSHFKADLPPFILERFESLEKSD
eukprot:Colp12_sorted_trinity150504_noHs@10916